MGLVADRFGNLFVAEAGNNVVREILSNGAIGTIAGDGVQGFSGDGGTATVAQLSAVQGVAVDAGGNVFIADTGNNRVREVADGAIATVAGTGNSGYVGDGGAATGAALSVAGLALDGTGNLFIGDPTNFRVREVLAKWEYRYGSGQRHEGIFRR